MFNTLSTQCLVLNALSTQCLVFRIVKINSFLVFVYKILYAIFNVKHSALTLSISTSYSSLWILQQSCHVQNEKHYHLKDVTYFFYWKHLKVKYAGLSSITKWDFQLSYAFHSILLMHTWTYVKIIFNVKSFSFYQHLIPRAVSAH